MVVLVIYWAVLLSLMVVLVILWDGQRVDMLEVRVEPSMDDPLSQMVKMEWECAVWEYVVWECGVWEFGEWEYEMWTERERTW